MRDPAGQRAKGFHFLGLPQALFGLLAGGLGATLRRDIADRGGNHTPANGFDRREADLHGENLAGLSRREQRAVPVAHRPRRRRQHHRQGAGTRRRQRSRRPSRGVLGLQSPPQFDGVAPCEEFQRRVRQVEPGIDERPSDEVRSLAARAPEQPGIDRADDFIRPHEHRGRAEAIEQAMKRGDQHLGIARQDSGFLHGAATDSAAVEKPGMGRHRGTSTARKVTNQLNENAGAAGATNSAPSSPSMRQPPTRDARSAEHSAPICGTIRPWHGKPWSSLR